MAERRNAIADVLGDESPMAALAAAANPQKRPQTPVEQQEGQPRPEVRQTEPKTPEIRSRRRGARRGAAEPLERAKRMKVSIEEERTIDDLVARIGREVGTKVQFSHVARAMWSLLLEAESSLSKVNAPRLRRPENGKLEALAEFEADLAQYLLEVFQATPRARR